MNSRLEQYVRELEEGLVGLSETRRAEELAEIRQHLRASIAAYQEMGMTEAEATEEAVRQFGAARLVSGGLRKALWREKTIMPDTVAAAAFVAVAGSLALADILDPLTSLLNVPFGPTLTPAYLVYWGAYRVFPPDIGRILCRASRSASWGERDAARRIRLLCLYRSKPCSLPCDGARRNGLSPA